MNLLKLHGFLAIQGLLYGCRFKLEHGVRSRNHVKKQTKPQNKSYRNFHNLRNFQAKAQSSLVDSNKVACKSRLVIYAPPHAPELQLENNFPETTNKVKGNNVDADSIK